MSEIRLERLDGTLRVHFGGRIVAETTRAFMVHETGLPGRYYVPREDVRAELSDGQGNGTCPWKGRWKHIDLRTEDKAASNVAWTYFETMPVCDPVRDYIAFYPEKVDSIVLSAP
jgi:uncharacterized protein (DUF427 family)